MVSARSCLHVTFLASTLFACLVAGGRHLPAGAVHWHSANNELAEPLAVVDARGMALNKKRANADGAQWDDLGWAWGKKRSDPTVRERYLRTMRALSEVKKDPDWHDLGWAWGRRR